MPRMSLLSKAEKEAFESPPLFNAADRKRYFDTPPRIEALLETLRTPTNQVGFLLMLGYFKVSKRFYRGQFHSGDLQFIARRMGYFPEMVDPSSLGETTFRRFRGEVLNYLGFKPFGSESRYELAQHLGPMVRSQARPKFMLLRSIDFLEQRKTEIPTLQALSDLILGEIKRHRGTLNECVEQSLSSGGRSMLDDLLEQTGGSDPESQRFQRYRLTLLKRVSQSMRVKKIRAAVEGLLTLREVYTEIESVIGSLDLSNEGVRFYANSVAKSRIFQVSRRQEEDRYLHLVCFIAHQYQRSQDTLVDVFLQSVQASVNACRRKHKEAYYEGRAARRRSLRDFAVSVNRHALNPLSEIEAIVFDHGIADADFLWCPQNVVASTLTSPGATIQFIDSAGVTWFELAVFGTGEDVSYRIGGGAGTWVATGFQASAAFSNFDQVSLSFDLANDRVSFDFYETAAATNHTVLSNAPLGGDMDYLSKMGLFMQAENTKNYLDDFDFTINRIPEPASGFTALVAAAAAFGRRRSRR